MTVFDASSARDYINSLYLYVLDRTQVSDREMSYWIDYLLKSQDAADTLRRFGRSEENSKRQNAMRQKLGGYPSGHFYSPIVDLGEFERDRERIYKSRDLLGVDLNTAHQIEVFGELRDFIKSIPFSDASDGRHRYYYDNTSYGFGDACIFWGMLNRLKPRRIIEIGSGYTSALALDTIDILGLGTTCTFIEPYPKLLMDVAQPIDSRHTVLETFVQAVDPSIVEALGPDDVLFIDSSHVVKSGSDVHFEITELLPRLRSGVVVHFHDVFYPFEYPYRWIAQQRKSWNELYFLHAFLIWNKAFSIEFFNHYFIHNHLSAFETVDPPTLARLRVNPGGGLWLRKC